MADPIGYRRAAPGTQPDYLYPPYRSTAKRAPTKPLIRIPHTLSEVTGPMFGQDRVSPTDSVGPMFGQDRVSPTDSDLTGQHAAPPIGERIIVSGRVLDEDGRAVPHTLVELWQCNATGRYRHEIDQHDAPLDPNFSGAGRAMTDGEGRYRFLTIKPGAYPWGNHANGWRPAHIHFSLFGPSFMTRLVTQMYFPGDPLLPLDPIFNSVTESGARERMVSAFDMELTEQDFALGFRFDIVLRGRDATPMVG